MARERRAWERKTPSWSVWQVFIVVMSSLIIPWTIYVMFSSKFSITSVSDIVAAASDTVSSVNPHYLSLSDRQAGEAAREKVRWQAEQMYNIKNAENGPTSSEQGELADVVRHAVEEAVLKLKKDAPPASVATTADVIPAVPAVDARSAPVSKAAATEDVETRMVYTKPPPNETPLEKKKRIKAESEIVHEQRMKYRKDKNQKDHLPTPFVNPISRKVAEYAKIPLVPVKGPLPTNGMKPLYGRKHQGGDAVFALACKYPKEYFQRFVGSLRKFDYTGDIVLAVSPPAEMKPGLGPYLEKTGVLAYPFEVNCYGIDNCVLKDDFLGYPDPRPYRTFANIRYALYEYWMAHYSAKSYILILDFRDTFFQKDPFLAFGYPISERTPKYELQVYAENYQVKNIGKCVYNSMWVGRCFSKAALASIKHLPVLCSGSTLGSYSAIRFYLATMLTAFDTQKCWLKGIESDQGYQNYLFHKGFFNTEEGNATLFHQGYGNVNTIGAMNGFRVPKEMKGRLDTHWKIIDEDGFVLNYDRTRSPVVHQWDRFADQLTSFVDSGKIYDFDPDDKKNPANRKRPMNLEKAIKIDRNA